MLIEQISEFSGLFSEIKKALAESKAMLDKMNRMNTLALDNFIKIINSSQSGLDPVVIAKYAIEKIVEISKEP